ncbi:pseudouridine synthase [Opitutus sp. ER46]|uniref:pseudouridine synthase n=1 Tax=Opitutus sp. ER46 TaxID=2161864 RepID=UPI000D2F860F|nr:pseudouridine synthase [Opitutus sp. ER46]PTX92632.1 rRNA pseudouridine synthase [Opitutus sp. ER46]
MATAEPIRLQKYLADAGICSRRSAEALIAQGEVWVNGEAATLGQKITPGIDKVTVSGKPVRSAAQPKITVAVHKPRGLVCSNDDPHHAATVFELLPREFARYRFFCAGRLDLDSEGLVILTTDGDLAHRLMHPSNTVVKRYQVTLVKPFPASRLLQLVRGLVIEGERLQVERAALINAGVSEAAADLDVHMHHGKKREIRQLFLAMGYEVKRLRRYQIGALQLKGIPLRAGKVLSTKEIDSLFRNPSTPRAPFEARARSIPTAPVNDED